VSINRRTAEVDFRRFPSGPSAIRGRLHEHALEWLKQGLHNVRFTQSDLALISSDRPFDAVVGRYILMFLPDPAAVFAQGA